MEGSVLEVRQIAVEEGNCGEAIPGLLEDAGREWPEESGRAIQRGHAPATSQRG